MAEHERFKFKSLEQVLAKVEELGLELPVSEDLSILAAPIRYGRMELPNRLAVQPMEGCDGTAEGAPSDLTRRRYRRFAAGGAGLLWVEACAVVPEARANPRQLYLHHGTVGAFRAMVEEARAAAREALGQRPGLILQLTHSGRYSRPGRRPAPIIAHHSAILDPQHHLPPDYPLITDEELDALQERYVEAALLAREAGFDGVDIKSCHRYLISELLASFTREESRYGGAYENRVRMLLETVQRVQAAVPDLEVTTRLNVYDAIPYPYGWGVDRADFQQPDLTEPLRLIGQLRGLGFAGLNVTVANPYFNPHYGRPFDSPIQGGYIPPEHPLEGVARFVRLTREVQQTFPDLVVVGTGYSWLRHFFPYFAAAAMQQGWVSVVGLGRGALAYPDFARDLLSRGGMDRLRVCLTCSSCTQIMRDDGRAGCVPRDHEVYAPIYWVGRRRDPAKIRQWAAECRQCVDPNCAAHCPAGIDIPAFLQAVAEGDDPLAYRILRRANLLPEVCGVVCPVEVQCQGHCVQNYLGEGAVPVAEIQRYVSQRAREEGWAALEVPPEWTGKTVAIIGAGPAGLSCAAGLLERGHAVRIIERAAQPGGKAVSVIPVDRLSREEAEAEIQAIFDAVPPDRLEWRFHTALGPDYTLDDVLAEKPDAVFLAFGLGNTASLAGTAHGARGTGHRAEVGSRQSAVGSRQSEIRNPKSEISAGRPEGVMDAEAFLEEMNRHPEQRVRGRVAVIGGGNTALDAAVMAQKRGADDVYLVYRRSFEQMPAWPGERHRAIQAGVHFLILTQPVGYETDEANRVRGVRVVRTELGAPDESGRRRPHPRPETEHTWPVDLVIEALGQSVAPEVAAVLAGVELTRSGLVQVDPETWMTSREGVFAAGDVVNGGATVVQAIAEGREAARRIDAYLG